MKFRSPEIANLTYPTILRELDAAIVVLDKKFRVVGINSLGRNLLKGELGQPSNNPAGGDWEGWLQRTASSVDGSPFAEKLTVVNDSMERFFNLQVMPIHNRQQEVTAYVFVMRDITHVKIAQETLDGARNRFELLFSFIHDLRTPLNGISGLAEMIELGTLGPLNDKQKEAAQRMLERCDHLTGLINEFVNQAKLEYKQQELIQEDLDRLRLP